MAVLTKRNAPDSVHRTLLVWAQQQGHSTEAEVREILAPLVKRTAHSPADELAALGREIGLITRILPALNRRGTKRPPNR